MHPKFYDSDVDAVVVPLRTAVDPPVAARKDPPAHGSDDEDSRNELAEPDNTENEQLSKPLPMVAVSHLAVLGSVSDAEHGPLTSSQWTQCDPPPRAYGSDNNENEHMKSSLVSPLPWLLHPRQPPCSSANSAAAESPSGRVANSKSILMYVSHSKHSSDDDGDTRDDACLSPHFDHGTNQDAADHDQSELDTAGADGPDSQSIDRFEQNDHVTTTVATLSNSRAELAAPDVYATLGRGKIPAPDNETMDDCPDWTTRRVVVNLASHMKVWNEQMAVTPVSTSMVALASREPSLVIPQYAITTPVVEIEAETRFMSTTPSWMPTPFRSNGPTQNILARRAARKWWSKGTIPSMSFDEPLPYSSSSTVVATGVPSMAKVGAVRRRQRRRPARDGTLDNAPISPSLSVETIAQTATATTTIPSAMNEMAMKCGRTSLTNKQWMRKISARSNVAR
jgi:hypothetical protein